MAWAYVRSPSSRDVREAFGLSAWVQASYNDLVLVTRSVRMQTKTTRWATSVITYVNKKRSGPSIGMAVEEAVAVRTADFRIGRDAGLGLEGLVVRVGARGAWWRRRVRLGDGN